MLKTNFLMVVDFARLHMRKGSFIDQSLLFKDLKKYFRSSDKEQTIVMELT